MYNMSGSTGLSTIGASNGVAGKPQQTAIDSALATTIAVMYNYYDTALTTSNAGGIVTSGANSIVLNPYGVNPVDSTNMTDGSMPLATFLSLFYPTNAGYFSVNQSNRNNPAVILSSQTYSSTNSESSKFSLVQFLLRAYCTQKGVAVNSLDPRLVVLLQKECFPVQTLASITGTSIAMTWDEVINSFLSSGLINPGDPDDNVVVPLAVVVNVHSFVLDIDLSIKFIYYVKVDGYVASDTPPAQP